MADRREKEVARLLDGPQPPVPPGLADAAARRGLRVLRRRRLVRRTAVLLALLALVVFTVWALLAQPFYGDPAPAPPGIGW